MSDGGGGDGTPDVGSLVEARHPQQAWRGWRQGTVTQRFDFSGACRVDFGGAGGASSSASERVVIGEGCLRQPINPGLMRQLSLGGQDAVRMMDADKSQREEAAGNLRLVKSTGNAADYSALKAALKSNSFGEVARLMLSFGANRNGGGGGQQQGASSTASDTLREAGNVEYRKAFNTGRPPSFRVGNLRAAVKKYDESLGAASTQTEWLRASKNRGMALACIAEIEQQNDLKTRGTDGWLGEGGGGGGGIHQFVIGVTAEALQGLTRCAHDEARCGQMGYEWVQVVHARVETVFDQFLAYLHEATLNPGSRCSALERLIVTVAEEPSSSRAGREEARVQQRRCVVLCRARLQCAREFFNAGVVAAGNDDPGRAKWCLEEMQRYTIETAADLNDATAVLGSFSEALLNELHEMEATQALHLAQAESALLRQRAAAMLEVAVLQDEVVDFEMVWDAADTLRHAARLSANARDTEGEAIALSHMGSVFGEILKVEAIAERVCNASLALARAMAPRVFFHCEWHRQAIALVERYRQARYRKNSEGEQAPPAIRAQIKPTIDAIEAAMPAGDSKRRRGYLLLRHIYGRGGTAPRRPDDRIDNIAALEHADREAVTKALRRALLHYHPDKNTIAEHGEAWHFLSKAITQMLTDCYNSLKD